MDKITVTIDKKFMNIGITIDKKFLIADTNDSKNWDTLKIPLPNGSWNIYSINNNNEITLENE